MASRVRQPRRRCPVAGITTRRIRPAGDDASSPAIGCRSFQQGGYDRVVQALAQRADQPRARHAVPSGFDHASGPGWHGELTPSGSTHVVHPGLPH